MTELCDVLENGDCIEDFDDPAEIAVISIISECIKHQMRIIESEGKSAVDWLMGD